MIKINVDEAYAFDMLSILEVKYDQDNCQTNLENFQNFAEVIENQIGTLLEEILASDEYGYLKTTNKILFNFIDDIKNESGGEISAKDIDDMNYERWKYKNDLQKKFFGKETGEVKIGYEK